MPVTLYAQGWAEVVVLDRSSAYVASGASLGLTRDAASAAAAHVTAGDLPGPFAAAPEEARKGTAIGSS